MRRRSVIWPSRKRRPQQFGLLSLLCFMAIVASIVAAKMYVCATIIFGAGVITIVGDWLSAISLPIQRPFPSATPRSRFWFSLTKREERQLIPEPILVAIAYVAGFKIWHFMAIMFCPFGRPYDPLFFQKLFDLPGAFGLSLRLVEHIVNGVVLVYLIVNYLVLLLPHHHSARNERILVAIAMSLVAAMHFAIP